MKVNHNFFRTVILFLFVFAIANIYAGDVNSDDIQTAARRWISANAIFKAEQPDAKPTDAIRMTDPDGKQLPLWHVPLTPSGYLIMAADDTLPPVVAFDTKATFSKSSPTPLPTMLDKQGSIFQEALDHPQTRGNTIAQDNQLRWKRLLSPTRADSVTPSTIITPPMLETEWDQISPYNIFSPSYIDYDRRSLAGCVPIAIAQILKYHEWPIAGIGTQIYKDVNGHLRATLKADFSFPFEWNLIENNYAMTDETNITTSELAVARLAMEMGVLVNANYEPRGTGASINKIKNYLYLYLGYSKDAQHDYFTSQDPLSMQILYMRLHDDMASKRPALVAIPDHLFVADGLGTIDNLDYYHFNYGWGGSENGWYLLTDGYEETIVNEAITNITPAPVPVFKQMSIEQNSTLMLSWDFPKQLKADMFRLTKTTEENSTIICSSIDGSERSYELTEQTGTNTYTLEAFIDGEWQTPSEGCTIKIVDNPAPLPVLAYDEVLESIKGAAVTTNITSNVPLAVVSVTSSRPDILPDNAITVTGDGTSWMLDIAPIQQAIGNVLLYLTATDTVGNIVKKTILVRLKGGALYWFDDFDDALYEAEDTGKMILLVEDFYSWAEASDFCNDICEIDDIKEYLLDNYVLWYARNFDWEASRFTSDLYGVPPYAVIIDPDDTRQKIRGICDPSADEFRMFLNLDTLIFSMDDDEIYSPGTTYELEIFCDRKRAVIHYRLDAKTPTLEDPIYTDPITLTEDTTISAQIFLDDEPIGETITKNYVFLPDLIWYNSLEEAFEIAKASEKFILLVEDFYSTSLDSSFCQEICEIVDIKKMLVENYVLWYVYSFYDEESYQFTSELYGGYPYIVIIDPVTSKRICGACDLSSDELREFIDMDSLHFSLDAEEIYALGKIQELEISILQKQAVIHYRLDSNEPTTNDMVYTEPLSLTETTTVSARAFVNGEPVSDVVSKTYSFLPQIATPKLLASPSSFFTGSCLVTVSCDTPDVTIRYRTDGWSPNQSSPVFPEDGLTIDESCTVVVKCFKEGMKDSEVARCKLVALMELPEANEIAQSDDITLYSSLEAPWILQTEISHSQPSAMRSAAINDSQSTSLVAKVTGAGMLSFHWKASSEYTDKLTFSIDGIQRTYISGLAGWIQENYTVIGEGDHYLTWTYSKDYSISSHSDCAWVDDIVWKGFVSLNIDIEDAIGFGEYAKYDCKVTWSDDSVSSTLAWWTLSSTEYANLYRNAYVINENKTGVNQTVTLNATVDFGDKKLMTSKDIFLCSGPSQQVATPILNVDETVYFSDNLYVTATCDTPNATIRYTLNGSIPMSFSPVFPENGLNITESSFLTVKAFRQDMKSSNPVQSKLISLTEMSSFSSGDGILFEFMDAPWFIQRKTFNSAPTALQSASINNSEKTSMIAKVTGPGILAFYWKASSEKSHDELSFSIDGVKQDKISGDTAWEQKCFTITGEGDHYLKWTYSKDSYISSYSDCAWVDDVSWIKAADVTPTSAFEYSVEDGAATITKFIGKQTDVSIPASINGYPVVAIGDSAFENCENLETVAIPSGVISIGEDAFGGSTSILSVTIPNSVLSIGDRAFSCWSSRLESVFIPASVEYIGEFAFSYSDSLISITVDDENPEYTSQNGVLFSKDMSILIQYPGGISDTHYDIPDSVTTIGSSAFSNNSALVSVGIPDSVEIIESEAFQLCDNLFSLTLPSSVKSIGSSAFGYCYELTEINIPNGMTSLEMYTFNNCSKLTAITLPNSLSSIKWRAFFSCTALESITIPENITSISSGAFDGCTNLQYVEFMGGIPSLSSDSFPTPITFYVLPGKGWKNFEAPDGVTVVFMPSKLTLSLSRGWNLCSIPFTPNDESVVALKETGVCWGWVNGRFQPLETILAGQGFWIYAPSKRELLLKGEEAEPMPLHKGWNLIGPVGDDYCPQDVTGIWQVNRRNMEQISIEKNERSLQPGKGYWIFIK